jgi:hypothetical protein
LIRNRTNVFDKQLMEIVIRVFSVRCDGAGSLAGLQREVQRKEHDACR